MGECANPFSGGKKMQGPGASPPWIPG